MYLSPHCKNLPSDYYGKILLLLVVALLLIRIEKSLDYTKSRLLASHSSILLSSLVSRASI